MEKQPDSKASRGLSKWAHLLPADLGLGTEEATSLAVCLGKTGAGRKNLPPTCFSLNSMAGASAVCCLSDLAFRLANWIAWRNQFSLLSSVKWGQLHSLELLNSI